MSACPHRGFTLVEVLVALTIVAMGLAALMSAVSGTANASGYLREKSLAQWIALNRLTEVRLGIQKLSAAAAIGNKNSTSTGDTGELEYAGRQWHYDTRYFDTSIPSMKRVIVRVWAGTTDTKGNPLAETTGFLGTAVAPPGSSGSVNWTQGSEVPQPVAQGAAGAAGAAGQNGQPSGPGRNPSLPVIPGRNGIPGQGIGSSIGSGDSGGTDTSGDPALNGGQP